MEKFKFLAKNKISELPREAGVYVFSDGRKILYIGKATNIKNRVKNHFQQPRSLWEKSLLRPRFQRSFGGRVGFIKTDSEIEALILEAKLIKKYQPRFNVMWKDDKNYFYVVIARNKQGIPHVCTTHQPKTQISNLKAQNHNSKVKTILIGPFTDGAALKKTLRFLRKIFPYYSSKKHPENLCPWCHLKLCPGPNPDIKKCKKDVKNLISVLKGKRQSVLKKMKREMLNASRSQEFEAAGAIRDQIESLEKVISNAKVFDRDKLRFSWQEIQKALRNLLKTKRSVFKIEGCDISNIRGKKATGSMVSVQGGPASGWVLDKKNYRKFKIKTESEPNDVAMIKEVLERRFRHPEWKPPELILIDGGKAQLNAALQIKKSRPRAGKTKFFALAKKKNELFIEGRKEPVLLKNLPRGISDLILQVRDESHRFALKYHQKLRELDLKDNF